MKRLIKVLEAALDNAERPGENDKPNVYKIKVYTWLLHTQHYSEAVRYANKVVLEFPHDDVERIIKKYEHKKIQEILQMPLQDFECTYYVFKILCNHCQFIERSRDDRS